MTTTCQICGRPIKANSGVIAHHGYKRPGRGWQTASCFGAHYQPYEVACDALPAAIALIKAFISSQTAALTDLFINPPAQFDATSRDAYGRRCGAERILHRPEGWAPGVKPAVFLPNTYAQSFWHEVRSVETQLTFAAQDLEFMEQRLLSWKAA